MSYPQLQLPNSGKEEFTEYSRWRLLVNDGGRQTWHYLKTDEECEQWPQKLDDKYWLGLPLNLPILPPAKDPLSAARNGYTFYKHLQSDDGHWGGDCGGPMFILPGLVIGSYVSGMGFEHEEKLEMIRYVFNRAHPQDGGWGIHIEGPSTVFGTALNYAALRILGVSAEHPVLVKARTTLHKLGGATCIPTWGKFWLSILNVFEWEGNNPIPPELWLLPDWLPFHPHRWWIFVRTVYVPMSYLYGVRFKAEENDLILALREELYTENYYKIHWPSQRNNVAEVDLYSPHTTLLDTINIVLSAYECCHIPPLRRAACNRAYELIVFEDENTSYLTISPVSKMLNLVARAYVEGPESEAYKQHEIKRRDFMWLGHEGMMMCVSNGSQLWDTGFITQALVASGLGEEGDNKECLIKALGWLERCQMTENPKHYETSYRHRTKGAWPFSTKEQGYTVSDCTGEGLKGVLCIQEHLKSTPKLVSQQRLRDAVDCMLTLQNPDGGFATCEEIRGPKWLDLVNPAEVFGDIMIERNHPECTTSVITALSIFTKHDSDYRSEDIARTIRDGVVYLKSVQNPDGGWVGSWGICFTYASHFALESLSLVGETYENSEHAQRACKFLLRKQRSDGGWGESYKSCEKGVWVEHADTQVVQTCWAAMSLMYARYPNPEPVRRAVKLVMERQLPNGSWPREAIEGAINKNCAISYPHFKLSFPIWMLGQANVYLAQFDKNGIRNEATNGHHDRASL